MHLAEGMLSTPVLVTGYALAAAGVAQGLRKLDDEAIPRTAVLTAGFFVASLIHVPLGPGSVHLVLNGLAGAVLGWCAAPAIFIGLLLQAVLFGFGGLTTLGVNTVILAGPAVLFGVLLGPPLRRSGRSAFVLGGLCGALSILSSALLAAAALGASERAFLPAAGLLLAAHAPLVVVEFVLTGSVTVFLQKVRPAFLGAEAAAAAS